MEPISLSPTRRLRYTLILQSGGGRVVTYAYLVHTDEGTADRLEPPAAEAMLRNLGVLATDVIASRGRLLIPQ